MDELDQREFLGVENWCIGNAAEVVVLLQKLKTQKVNTIE